ncbi:hypothetical protein V8G54_037568 [Vigna mungo]|uniref:non-specific serine/threonine protein kinase n=1 Tax=Vigna mungo TaxID=3915 RepID=A0AAQ3MKI9_VIGMU
MEPNLGYSRIFRLLFLASTSLIFLSHWAYAATPKLNNQEMKALKDIGSKIGKKDWDFGVDPCSGKGSWNVSDDRKGFQSSVIFLKGQNLSGTLSPMFSQLQYLTILDLSRNIITGSIPEQWSTMGLVEISFMGNKLSGPFPKVLTNITTLRNLSIEGNQFWGHIPTEIEKLVNLEKLVLSSNGFTGALPPSLSKLTKLIDLRISDNNFFGKIPDFISNWTVIEKLHMHGCSLEGPIPSSISVLTRLSDLRITDLKGDKTSAFPPLNNLKSMRTLDLSYNNLSGEIPESFAELDKVDFMYLTGNMLSGIIPAWILGNNKNINLAESYSSSVDTQNKIHSCLKRNFPCPASVSQYQYALNINCGGNEANISGHIYEADVERKGAAMLYTGQVWALSSTGNFMDNDIDSDPYIVANTSRLNNVSALSSQLYTTARVSPLALTYYGLCLINGNYTIKLHFAEIIFINDRSLNSLGKRVFDVYIQGNLVLKDFDIQREAGGTGKPIVKTFNATVTQHTLKIHFYWAGKGTTGIPTRGVYGPLVSAISVSPNFKPPSGKDDSRTDVILAIGIVAGVLVLLLLGLVFMRWMGWLGGKDPVYKDNLGGLGLLSDGTIIAVKQLSSKSKQGNREFVNEMGLISGLQHPNLVKLYGCCVEGNQLILIYEYMENNCLSRILFGKLHDESGLSILAAYVLQERGSILELVDPDLGSEYSTEEAMVVLNVALLCTNASPTLRPTMSQAVSMLEGWTDIQDLLSDPGYSAVSSSSKYKSIRNHFWQNPSRTHSMSIPSVYTDSSGSHVETEMSYRLVTTVNSDGSDKSN